MSTILFFWYKGELIERTSFPDNDSDMRKDTSCIGYSVLRRHFISPKNTAGYAFNTFFFHIDDADIDRVVPTEFRTRLLLMGII